MLESRNPRRSRRRPAPQGNPGVPSARRRPEQPGRPSNLARPNVNGSSDSSSQWNQPPKLARRPRPDNAPRRADSFNLRNLLSNDSPRVEGGRRDGGSKAPSSRLQAPLQSPRGGSLGKPSGRSVVPFAPHPTPLHPRPVNPAQPPRRRPSQPGSVAGSRLKGRPKPMPKPVRKPVSPMVHGLRLLILGVGVGAIAGTILSFFNPASLSENNSASNALIPEAVAEVAASPLQSPPLGQELAPLKASLQGLASQIPDITPGVFVVDLDSNNYVEVNGTRSFPAASTIKVPVLVALLQDVDSGKVRLDETLEMLESDLAEGSGDMQFQPVGTTYSVLETAELMITISDNTATNMLIRRLGGIEAMNQRFRSWGMTNTVLRNPLADLGGTNTTSPRELTDLLVKVSQGNLLSIRSRDRLMSIMQGTVTRTLIPAGVADDRAIIAHKTGTIDNMVGDTGIVDMPNGKRFIVTVLMERPIDDERAQELIRQMCNEIYNYLAVGNAGMNPAIAPPIPSDEANVTPETEPTESTF